jgi:hypothetical protein
VHRLNLYLLLFISFVESVGFFVIKTKHFLKTNITAYVSNSDMVLSVLRKNHATKRYLV